MDRLLKLFSAKEANYLFACTLVVFLAAFLRFYKLGDPSMWLDEAIFANLLTNSYTFHEYFLDYRTYSPALWPAVQWLICSESSPALFFRLVSAIAGVGTIIIILSLPLAGCSRSVALVAGLWAAISPLLVEYSQEAREYSLGSFFAALLVSSFLAYWNKPESLRSLSGLCLAIFLAPLASYGNVLLSGAFIGVHLICLLLERKKLTCSSFAFFLAFIFGIISTLILTARFQIGLKDADGNWLYNSLWFLMPHYPPDGILHSLKWLKVSLKDYLAWAWGGGRTVEVISLAVALWFFANPKKQFLLSRGGRLLMVMACLIFGSLCLAFLGKYPFGGLRYHVFAIPLLIIVACEALVFIKNRMQLGLLSFLLLFGFIVVYGSVVELPVVYKEKQDIQGAINSLPGGTLDQQVFLYEKAAYATRFHFPDRKFNYSRSMDVKSVFSEFKSHNFPAVFLVFNDSMSPEDFQSIEGEILKLKTQGYRVIQDHRFCGILVIQIEKIKADI